MKTDAFTRRRLLSTMPAAAAAMAPVAATALCRLPASKRCRLTRLLTKRRRHLASKRIGTVAIGPPCPAQAAKPNDLPNHKG